MKISCIAIDDEVLALNKIKRFISRVDFLELHNTFDNAKDAFKSIESNPIDLIFLDIEMPETNGFEFLNKISNKPYVIMTTAFDQYALKSYEFSVCDYLLKPIQFDRFLVAVEKVYSLINNKVIAQSDRESTNKEKEHIHVKSSGNIIKIFIDDILYIEGMKDYLAINLKDNRVLTLMSFNKLLDKLPQSLFIRIHKSFLIAINKIDEFKCQEIKIGDNIIPVSRTYKNQVNNLKNKLV